MTALVLPLPAARAQLSQEESRFLGYLVDTLRYPDTAERYLDQLLSKHATSAETRADLEWTRVDILKLQGEVEKSLELAETLKKRYPRHSRSSLADLGQIGRIMGEVSQAFDRATTDPENAEEHRQKGIEIFNKQVEPALDSLVKDLNDKVDQQQALYSKTLERRPDAPPPEELGTLRANRDNVELVRISLLRVYADVLRSFPSLDETRVAILKKGLDYASRYVQERANNRLLQWQAQLQKGRYEIELEMFTQAYEDISILIGIRPPIPRGSTPPPDLVDYIKKLHIEAVLYAAQAANRAGLHEEAVDAVLMGIIESTEGPYALSDSLRDPRLEPYHVLALLERAIGIAGNGDTTQGLALVQEIIDRYKSDTGNPKATAFVNDARKGLGRIAEVTGATLTAEAYFEGGMGKFSEKRFGEATSLFLLALESTTESDRREVLPKALVKIAEIQYILGNGAEAVMAFLELQKQVPVLGKEHPLIKKAANDALSIATNLARGNRSHAGYGALERLADAFLTEVGGEGPPGAIEFAKAQEQELLGNLAQAAEIYGSIPEMHDGKPEPLYLRAQVKAIDCRVQLWLSNSKRQEEEAVQTVRGYLEPLAEIARRAREKGQERPQVVSSWVTHQIHQELGEPEKSLEALAPFLDRYTDDTQYRPAALYYLLESQIKLDRGAEAEKTYQILKRDFPDHLTSYYGALELTSYFRSIGEDGKAADYILDYASHPRATEELKSLGNIMDIVDLLIEADRIDLAKKWLTEAEGMVSGDATEAGKRVFYRRAKMAFQEKNYGQVVKSLKDYLDKFGEPPASEADGPYILQLYGEALLRQGASDKNASSRVRTLKNALRYLLKAIIAVRDRRSLEGSEGTKATRDYWVWSYQVMVTYKLLAQAGLKQGWVKINEFVTEQEQTSMGGDKLKQKFLELREEARSKI